MRLAAGLRPDHWGSYSAPPGPLTVIRGRRGRGSGRKGLEIGRDRKGREGKHVKGREEWEGEGRGGKGRKGWEGGGMVRGRERAEGGDRVQKGEGVSIWIFIQGPRVPSYASAQ